MAKRTHIAFAVTNDLSYDQRMQRICTSLARAGFKVTLLGRQKPDSKALPQREFEQLRLPLKHQKGKRFYWEHNQAIKKWFLNNDVDVIGAIDLDSIMGCALAANKKNIPYAYDAHEYFSELPEIVDRPLVKFVWKQLERRFLPGASAFYTINQSYADLFEKEYQKHFEIVRNATVLEPKEFPIKKEPYILYQGAVNVGRGVEEMIRAMQWIDCPLIICGKGDNYDDCVKLTKDLGLESKVDFRGFVEPEALKEITLKATLGFTFFTNQGMSYYYSLANRFFDYFHNGVPQLAIDFPEYRLINDEFEIAYLLSDLAPKKIAEAANRVIANPAEYQRLHNNCLAARKKYNWQEEEKKLIKIYSQWL